MTIRIHGNTKLPPQSRQMIHIGFYPTIETIRKIVDYCHRNGLASNGHQYNAGQHMHATVFYGAIALPPDYPKINVFNPPREIKKVPCPVKPLSLGSNIIPNRTSVAIIIPREVDGPIRGRSQKLYKKFGLRFHDDYDFHISISKVQLKGKFNTVQDYFRLPPYEGPIGFQSEMVSTNDLD